MTGDSRTAVAFRPEGSGYLASFSLEHLAASSGEMESVLQKASKAYGKRIRRMRSTLEENGRLRKARKSVPAVLMWDVGDEIFSLMEDLGQYNLEIDDLYGHLVRDLGVSRSTLKKVVAARRYFPERQDLPRDLEWSAIREAPKKYAKQLK